MASFADPMNKYAVGSGTCGHGPDVQGEKALVEGSATVNRAEGHTVVDHAFPPDLRERAAPCRWCRRIVVWTVHLCCDDVECKRKDRVARDGLAAARRVLEGARA